VRCLGLVLVFGHHSAIPVRFGARFSSAECAFFSRLGTTSRATDSKYVFLGMLFFRHGGKILN
jgi:hypothetical protein